MSIRKTAAIILFIACALPSFSQGLYIKGNYALIDERSSYNVFDRISPTFSNVLIVDFEYIPVRSKGNVVRIKNDDTRCVYNISYSEDKESSIFKLNQEGKDNLITIPLKKDGLKTNQWIKVHLEFDMAADLVKLRINGDESSRSLEQAKNSWSPRIWFGRSEHVIDVPDFKLCSLTVGDNNHSWFFPLNESEGEAVHDSNRKIVGHVTKPVWLINDAYYWKAGPSFSSKKVAGSNFNPNTQDIYYFNSDSLTAYNVQTGKVRIHQYLNQCPVGMRLGTNFIDQANDRLYVYEVADPPRGNTTIAYLDLRSFEWTTVTSEVLPVQLHHHSNHMDSETGKYMIFGGFGRTSYFNDFYSFDVNAGHWGKQQFTGDVITPRYFTSMGYNDADGCLYLFGGMGNEAGDQSVGRIYYYELYRIDPNNGVVKKMWEIPWNDENVVPVRNMFFPDKDNFYVLCYPEHASRSRLELYRFSTVTGKYDVLGDSIPIVSEKITTNANLYYSTQVNSLLAITQEFESNDIASTAKIYSISFPPVAAGVLALYNTSGSGSKLWLIMVSVLGVVAILCLTFMLLRNRRRPQETGKAPQPDNNIPEKDSAIESVSGRPIPDSLYLFGEFSMTDRQGREINYMLSSKLRQAFFLILYHSLDKGIASQELSKILWPDKSYEMSKNSRGVTLNNLRKIFGEMEGISLIHDHDKKSYRITISDECYSDYLDCLDIVSGNRLDENMAKFISIISRGKFLESEDSSILDPFKGYMESKIESAMYYYMEKSYAAGNYNATISLCDSFFTIDPLDKVSLQFLIKSLSRLDLKDEAKRRYYVFTADYKKTLGEEYDKPFASLLK